MDNEEITSIIIAIITLAVIINFKEILLLDFQNLPFAFLFAFILIAVNILGKKIMARKLDAGVNHKIWHFQQFGFKEAERLKSPAPFGIIIPLIFSAVSLGKIKFMTVMTYETTALKRRAARRHGPFSFTEMTDWHNALIGAAGIIITLLLSLVVYFIPGMEPLSRLAAFYAFFNMIPFSNLDGSKIFIGSRVLWYSLAIITLIFASYALLIP